MFDHMMTYRGYFYPFRGYHQQELCAYLTGLPIGLEEEDIEEILRGELRKLGDQALGRLAHVDPDDPKVVAVRAFVYALLGECRGYLGPLLTGLLLIEDDWTFIRSVIRNSDILWT